MGVCRLRAQDDSKLFIKHVNREFGFSLLPYRIVVQRLIKSFKYIQFEHPLREHNRTRTLWIPWHQRLTFREADEHHKRILKTTATDIIPATITDEQDWHVPIAQKLMQPPSTMVARDLKDFTIIKDELYHGGDGGLMALALSTAEGTTGLKVPRKLSSYNPLVRDVKSP